MRCIVTGLRGKNGFVEAHHITKGGRRLGHYFTLPLLPNIHAQVQSLGAKAWERRFGSQMDYLKQVYKILGLPVPEVKSKVYKRSEIIGQ